MRRMLGYAKRDRTITSTMMCGRCGAGGRRKNRSFRHYYGREAISFANYVRLWGTDQKIEVWLALDALVLKAMAIVLTAHLKPHLSLRCFHVA